MHDVGLWLTAHDRLSAVELQLIAYIPMHISSQFLKHYKEGNHYSQTLTSECFRSDVLLGHYITVTLEDKIFVNIIM